MLIGPKIWKCVSADTPSVPQGGIYGNVPWFREQCERYRLTLAWSWLHNCFMVFTQRGGQYLLQERYRRGFSRSTDGIVPLTEHHFWLLIYLWDRCCKVKHESVMANRALAERQYEDEVRKDWEEHMEEIRPDVMREMSLRRGYNTPIIMPLPKKIVTRRELMAQRQRKQFRKKKILVEVN